MLGKYGITVPQGKWQMPESNLVGSFLVLNSIFENDGIFRGVELYALKNGSIKIEVYFINTYKHVKFKIYTYK